MQARIIQSIKGRGDHSDDDLVVSEQILNFTALVENGENWQAFASYRPTQDAM
jgi:hypothetical protein